MSIERKIIVGLLALMFILGVVWIDAVFAFQNEPTGWGGNGWGTPVGEINCGLEKIKSIEEINIDVYRPDIKLKTSRAMLVFLGGRLAVVTTKTNDLKYIELFVGLHIQLYGQPTETQDNYMIWRGQTTNIQLDVVRGISTRGSPAGMDLVNALLVWHQSKKAEKKDTEGRESI